MSMIVDRSMAMYSSTQKAHSLTAKKVLAGRKLGTATQVGPLKIVPVLDSPLVPGLFNPFSHETHLQNTAFIGHIHLINPTQYPVIVPAHTLFHMENGTVQVMGRTLFIGPKSSVKIADAARVSMEPVLGRAIPTQAILPFPLRSKALALEGIRGSTKLWGYICQFYGELGELPKEDLGHFFESFMPPMIEMQPLSHQTGALFYWEDQLMGLELSPDPNSWQSRQSAVYTSYMMALAFTETAPATPTTVQGHHLPAFSLKGRARKLDGYNQFIASSDKTFAGEVIQHMGQVGFASLFSPQLRLG